MLNKYYIQFITNGDLSFLLKSLYFGSKQCWLNTHMYTNIVFKSQIKISKEAFIYDIALRRVCLVKYLLSVPLEIQQRDDAKYVF